MCEHLCFLGFGSKVRCGVFNGHYKKLIKDIPNKTISKHHQQWQTITSKFFSEIINILMVATPNIHCRSVKATFLKIHIYVSFENSYFQKINIWKHQRFMLFFLTVLLIYCWGPQSLTTLSQHNCGRVLEWAPGRVLERLLERLPERLLEIRRWRSRATPGTIRRPRRFVARGERPNKKKWYNKINK